MTASSATLRSESAPVVGKGGLIRVSSGTAICLGLRRGALAAKPTTAYLLTYTGGKCLANCAFCSQARESSSEAEMLSRVKWPLYPLDSVLERIAAAAEEGTIRRVCVQALEYPGVSQGLAELVGAIRSISDLPLSVSCPPLSRDEMSRLSKLGVERIAVSLDAATEELFDSLKGSQVGCSRTWEDYLETLREAIACFGRGKVVVHLIAGLGETEQQMLSLIQEVVDMGAQPALFAFTPLPGTRLEGTAPPRVESYRRVQLGQSLMTGGHSRYWEMRFDEEGSLVDAGTSIDVLNALVSEGSPFMTSGCPACNRPYYNEEPLGPMYNYPKALTPEDRAQVRRQLASLLQGGS
ncbi:MAG: radical SAM protein [Candidatus Bathyarchaeia archaeon]